MCRLQEICAELQLSNDPARHSIQARYDRLAERWHTFCTAIFDRIRELKVSLNDSNFFKIANETNKIYTWLREAKQNLATVEQLDSDEKNKAFRKVAKEIRKSLNKTIERMDKLQKLHSKLGTSIEYTGVTVSMIWELWDEIQAELERQSLQLGEATAAQEANAFIEKLRDVNALLEKCAEQKANQTNTRTEDGEDFFSSFFQNSQL